MRILTTTRRLTLAIAMVLIAGCGESSDAAYDRGYDDGYAVGYNTTCEIRATLVAGDWDNKHYSLGYSEGQVAGTIACNNDKREGTVR